MGAERSARYNLDRMRRAVRSALHNLHASDHYLLEHGIHERAMSHRLAVYLELQFPGWDIDCEYNKFGGRPKLAPTASRSKRPDIIVHHRGRDYDNLLAVEIKKLQTICQSDHEKLEGCIHHLGYQWAVCVSINPDGAMLEWQSPTMAAPVVDELRWSELKEVGSAV